MKSVRTIQLVRISYLDKLANVDWQKVSRRFKSLKQIHQSLANKHFTQKTIQKIISQKPQIQQSLLNCIIDGLQNQNSSIGFYASKPEDYSRLSFYLSPLIKQRHSFGQNQNQKHDWNIPLGKCLLSELLPQFKTFSIRSRVARNIEGWNFVSNMSKTQRLELQSYIEEILRKLDIKGHYYSLSPGHSHQISKNKTQSLRDSHMLFEDMTIDPHFNCTGLASDWPHGRGIWISQDQKFVIWIGEQDHLRIISISKGNDLGMVDKQLFGLLQQLQSLSLKFSTHPRYGILSSCPSNIGTGKRTSVLGKIDHLAAKTTDFNLFKSKAHALNLQVRGKYGQNSPLDFSSLIDISCAKRLGVTEAEITFKLHQGLQSLFKTKTMS